jgi:MFS transporter, FSR family, fosmidomycin resistance protein
MDRRQQALRLQPMSTPSAALPAPLRQDASVMALVGLAHGTSHFFHMLLPPLFPVFVSEFGLSFAQVGLLTSLFFVVSGVGQATAGFVVDRFGARPILFASMLIFALAAITASMAQGMQGLVLTAVLAGLGNASFHPVDFSILNQRVSTPRLGHAYSVHGISGSLGWALAPVFLVGLAAVSNWRSAYVAAALLPLAVLAILLWNRDKIATETVAAHAVITRANGQNHSKNATSISFLKLPVVWWCFGFFLLSTITVAVIQSFSASILKALHGLSLQGAAYTVSAYMLCAALGAVVGGFMVAKHERSERVVIGSMLAGALLLLLCATGWLGAALTVVAVAATGFAVGVGNPSRDMMIKRATPKGATGRVYGTVYSGLDVGFAIAPLIFGVLMDKGYYAATLAGAALALLASAWAARGVGVRTLRA